MAEETRQELLEKRLMIGVIGIKTLPNKLRTLDDMEGRLLEGQRNLLVKLGIKALTGHPELYVFQQKILAIQEERTNIQKQVNFLKKQIIVDEEELKVLREKVEE